MNDTERIGTRVFNRGDMANVEHWGTITRLIPGTRYSGREFEITPDAEADRKPYTIPTIAIHDVDKGNGLTRFVTKEAYETLRAQQIAEFKARHVPATEEDRGA